MTDLATLYDECCYEKRCGLVHCQACRGRWSAELLKRIATEKEARYGTGDYPARNCLRHVTVLNALVPCDVKAIKAAIEQGRKDINSFKKKFRCTGLRGAFEIELVNPVAMMREQTCPAKIQTLSEMTGGKFESMTEIMALVHWHAVGFFNNGLSEDHRKWMKRKYPHHRQRRFDSLYKDQSIAESFSKLSSYPFKDRVTYNLKFATDGFKNEFYIEPDPLAFLVNCYKAISAKTLRINR